MHPFNAPQHLPCRRRCARPTWYRCSERWVWKQIITKQHRKCAEGPFPGEEARLGVVRDGVTGEGSLQDTATFQQRDKAGCGHMRYESTNTVLTSAHHYTVHVL